jgi:hypothetical protein
MDSKYLGKNIALPKDVHNALVEVQEELNNKLGFRPSLTETISYLIKAHKETSK